MIINQIVSGGGGSAPAHYLLMKNYDPNNTAILKHDGSKLIDLTGIKELGVYSLTYAYYEADVADAGATAWGNASGITVGSGAFDYAFCRANFTNKNVVMKGLVKTDGLGATYFNNTFTNSNVETVSFVDLTEINGYNSTAVVFQAMCSNCSSLTDVYFPSLSSILTTTRPFGASSANYAFRTTSANIHFPLAMQSVIEGLTGYSDKFGTTGSILFDL